MNGTGSFGEHFRELARHALTELPIRDNYFAAQICLGRYLDEQAVPTYLRADRFEALRRALDRIEIVTGEVGAVLRSLPDDTVSAFNFSNVFEWVPADAFAAMLGEAWRVGRPGARLCYRNLLVRRANPPALAGLLQPHPELAARLLWEDRSFVYSNFEAASVIKPAKRQEDV